MADASRRAYTLVWPEQQWRFYEPSPSRSGAPAAYSRTVHQIRSGDRDSLLRGHTTTSDAKNPLEAGDVASLGRGNEGVEKTSLLGRIRGHPSAIRDVLPSASHHLPRVGLFKPKDVRDVAVCVVERLPKDVGGSFRGRQLLQQ